MQTSTVWPDLNGACVSRGSLVRIDITSPPELASYLLNSDHESIIEAKLTALLRNAEFLVGKLRLSGRKFATKLVKSELGSEPCA